ncbi:MAG TPA: 2-hydroxyacid dehydrogenase [Fibrobacteria bacterium]|nr:2-hydroxyacid dehydrogenase [Fibrobacteria bacterium]
MRVTIFSSKEYERSLLAKAAGEAGHRLTLQPSRLNADTAVLSRGSKSVSAFVNDVLDAETLRVLAECGVGMVALRCAGFNNVDMAAASRLGIVVARVPAYSPHAVAEHTLTLALALSRKLCKAYNRVREGNFSLEGMLGTGLYGKTVGLIGTGKIGSATAGIFRGLGCKLIGFDVAPSAECLAMGMTYSTLPELMRNADIVSLHCPLTPETRHLIGKAEIDQMKQGAMLLNTSRGAVLETRAVIAGLKSGKIGNLGLDVYEEEADVFFEDLSGRGIQDDVLARLMTFPNVIVTGHQGFFTEEALSEIMRTTMENISEFERTGSCGNAVPPLKTIKP